MIFSPVQGFIFWALETNCIIPTWGRIQKQSHFLRIFSLSGTQVGAWAVIKINCSRDKSASNCYSSTTTSSKLSQCWLCVVTSTMDIFKTKATPRCHKHQGFIIIEKTWFWNVTSTVMYMLLSVISTSKIQFWEQTVLSVIWTGFYNFYQSHLLERDRTKCIGVSKVMV